MASEKDKVMLNQDSKYTHLCDHHKTQMEGCSNAYSELLTELFFLQHGGNYIDFVQFKKRPSQQLCDHIRQNPIISYESEKHKNLQDTTETLPIHSNEVHTSLPTSAPKVETPYRQNVLSIEKNQSSVSNSLQQLKRYSRNTLSDVYEDTIGSQEEILERAKQEAVVQRRVSELRKMGMWSQRRLPKVQEPPRTKAHWDYLLEEMRWLATDFAQERKWKRAAARKVVRMVAGYHKDVQERERKAEREEQQKLRRIASSVARQIRLFWSDIEKVVQYKQRCLLDEKRQKALDLHLNYIVDQTAKYSHWLTEGLTQPQEISSPSASRTSSHLGSDDDFLPRGASSDDEETIAFEECRQQEDVNDEVTLLKEESALPFDDLISQLPEDLVENIGKPLPNLKETSEESNSEGTVDETDKEKNSETISHEDGDISSDEKSKPTPISLRRSARKRHAGDDDNDDVEKKKQKPLDEKDETLGDVEFDAHLESSDDEATLQEQEAAEDIDHQKELADLQADNEMSIDELMKLYHGAFDKAENSPKCDLEEKMSTDSGSESEESEADASESEKQEIGMDYLLKAADDVSNKSQKQEDNNNNNDKIMSSPNKEITEVAAEAMSLQPTGHTLATTQVVTPIPSLLRHTLREYQHIGLDWLVTMYEKRLNGILADEMGLGKTIQTIALLAHLACEKGVWGPHLIVVPTSVMLNWEMELKKWCPGFKILTYYGSQKERKLKRMGWTKANAFHVCITSYKLVLQDHTSFRRKKWRYLILDEAQNIKNFKSQRWQTLLNFNSQRRLLLTGTPLQNNLMELWSLMHFLMPHVFQSHKEFKEWFSNPLTGMIEGLQEYNEKLVKRLHKVLRPFLLRRVKKDVEKQMPNKYEHVVRCHLSKRQRFLYEDFMSKASTKETLSGGHFMSVINVLMQLRKVCNHPNLFEPRPTVSSFVTPPITLRVPTLVHKVIELDHFQKVDFRSLNMHLPSLSKMSSVESDAIKRLKTSSKVIEGIDVVDEKKVSSYMPVTDKMRGVIRDKLSTQQIPVSSKVGLSQASKMDAEPARVPTTQSITLQYQTAHGTTKWATIPNGQIRQLPGGVVQIVTSSVNSRSSTPIPPAQDSIAESETEVTAVTRKGLNKKKLPAETYTRMLARKRVEKKESILSRLSRINDRRCEAEATYLPSNTISFLQSITTMFPTTSEKLMYPAVFENAVKSPLQRLKHLIFVLDRFIFVIPKVATSSVECEVAHPTPWRYYSLSSSLHHLRTWLSHELSPLHRITRKTRVQFPETRLIEYDCGKLQVLNVLLRRFWEEKHRILIFTQMTKVLDILEAFLSYHGYRYLRLDGSTHIEQRMARMERFNNDPRIFCFILSTRSGGIGVNLTGADTVVFYDSDWNPTMDAQAQDRCHRIGQTRDVHIYRLISEKTVEENILKKANQKRLLGDLAIEGGGFTTAFFQQQAIKDLFDDPSGLEELTEQPRQLTARQKALEAAKAENNEEVASEKQDLEKALLESEEKEDVVAAEMLKQEQDAVMEEFVDAEDKAGEEAGENLKLRVPKGSKVEEELKGIYQELSPVERYALHYLEESAEATNDLELQEAEAQVEQSKKDWELAHLVALKEEEERRLEEADEIFYTREGNQMFVSDISGEPMPLWLPPTPPRDDVYIDPAVCLLYTPIPMTEDQLPALFFKKERKRPKIDPSGVQGPTRKLSRIDVSVPKSLFNRPNVAFKRKDKSTKIRFPRSKVSLSSTPIKMTSTTATASPRENLETSMQTVKSAVDMVSTPDWIINEDWALLQAVQNVLDLPLSLVTMMPAHTPNWHLVADMVNAVGCIYRSPKQCKLRYENVILTREEGKSESTTPKKNLKGNKFPMKMKPPKAQKTSLLYNADSNHQFTTLYSNRFDACKVICSKRNPPSKSSTGTGQFQRNPNHTNILHECGIVYDKPLHAMEVAAKRAKRIASQKKTPGEQIFSGTIQPTPQVNVTSNISSGITVSQHALIVNGNSVVGKNALQVSAPGISQLTAIPLSASTSNIVANSAFARRSQQQVVQGTTAKLQAGKGAAPALTLRTIQGNAAQLQIHQHPISSVQSIPLSVSAQSPVVTVTTAIPCSSSVGSSRPTITYPARGINKLSALQHIRQATKQQTAQAVPVKQPQIRGTQQQLTQQTIQTAQLGGTILPTANTTIGGKKVQLTKTRPVTQQELEMLMKQQRSQIKTIQHRPQVQIAPIQAQVQAQQVRSHAAQQAAQQSNSKPLPITVPVTNLVPAVNLAHLSVTTSSAQVKPVIVSGTQQAALNHPQHQLILQQQLLKQRQITQQQRQVTTSKAQQQKAVYASVSGVPTPQLVVSGVSSTLKMSPQIPAHMLNQLVAQQKQQRSRIAKGTSIAAPPVTLTVTKLLQNTNPTIRHTLVPQITQMAQQVTQLPLSVATTIVPSAGVAGQQQRVLTQPRQQLQLPRLCQVTSCQSQGVTTSTIIASTPIQRHTPVVAASQVPQQVHIQSATSGSSPQLSIQMNSSQASLLISPHTTTASLNDSPARTVEDTTFSLQSMTR